MRPTIDWWMDGGVYTFVCEAQDVFLTKQSFFYIKENMKHHQKTIKIKIYANRKVMIPQKFHQSLQPLKVVKAWLKWIKKCCSNISSIQPNTHKTPLDQKTKNQNNIRTNLIYMTMAYGTATKFVASANKYWITTSNHTRMCTTSSHPSNMFSNPLQTSANINYNQSTFISQYYYWPITVQKNCAPIKAENL